MNSEIKIRYNKAGTKKWFIISIVTVLWGVLLIIFPFWFIRSDNPYVIKFVGYLLIVIFGFLAWFFGKKLFDKKPGLAIDEEGVLDYSSGLNIGKVFWRDVVDIREKSANGQRFMMVDVKNPEEYIEREVNPLKKRIMGINNRLYQTPINITSKGLNVEFEELYQLITESFAKFRK